MFGSQIVDRKCREKKIREEKQMKRNLKEKKKRGL